MTKKTPEQISYNMKQVKSKGSEIEVLLQKELWRRGLRYRKNVKSIEGKPDIAFIGNVLDVIRYETRERVDQRVEYGLSADAIVIVTFISFTTPLTHHLVIGIVRPNKDTVL